MDFNEFSDINRRRCEAANGFNHKLSDWSLSDWITAITGEIGEAANVVKKLNRIRDGIPGNKETEPQLRQKLRQEFADVLIYLDLASQAAGFNLGNVVMEVFEAKSKQLGYVDAIC